MEESLKDAIESVLVKVKTLRDTAFKSGNQEAYDKLGAAMSRLIDAKQAVKEA